MHGIAIDINNVGKILQQYVENLFDYPIRVY